MARFSDKKDKGAASIEALREELRREEEKLERANAKLEAAASTSPEAVTTDTEEEEELVEYVDGHRVERLYIVKFNSPILPFSKFPLHRNEYIKEFLKRYAKDKPYVQKILGVHFEKNKNTNCEGAIGIEI